MVSTMEPSDSEIPMAPPLEASPPAYAPHDPSQTPQGFGSHRWNCSKSWRRSCPCRACTWCAMGGGPGAAQPPARGHHSDATAAGCRRGGDGHGVTALELGTAAEARLCPGHGALSVVPAGDAADHCRHHARRGDPDNPPASETRRRPTPDSPSPSPPRNLCLVLHLTASALPPVLPLPVTEGG
jgi:hypothetical protein